MTADAKRSSKSKDKALPWSSVKDRASCPGLLKELGTAAWSISSLSLLCVLHQIYWRVSWCLGGDQINWSEFLFWYKPHCYTLLWAPWDELFRLILVFFVFWAGHDFPLQLWECAIAVLWTYNQFSWRLVTLSCAVQTKGLQLVFQDSCFRNYLITCAKNLWSCCVESGLNGIVGWKKNGDICKVQEFDFISKKWLLLLLYGWNCSECLDEIPISHLSVHAHGARPCLCSTMGLFNPTVTLLTHSLTQRQ